MSQLAKFQEAEKVFLCFSEDPVHKILDTNKEGTEIQPQCESRVYVCPGQNLTTSSTTLFSTLFSCKMSSKFDKIIYPIFVIPSFRYTLLLIWGAQSLFVIHTVSSNPPRSRSRSLRGNYGKTGMGTETNAFKPTRTGERASMPPLETTDTSICLSAQRFYMHSLFLGS